MARPISALPNHGLLKEKTSARLRTLTSKPIVWESNDSVVTSLYHYSSKAAKGFKRPNPINPLLCFPPSLHLNCISRDGDHSINKLPNPLTAASKILSSALPPGEHEIADGQTNAEPPFLILCFNFDMLSLGKSTQLIVLSHNCPKANWNVFFQLLRGNCSRMHSLDTYISQTSRRHL